MPQTYPTTFALARSALTRLALTRALCGGLLVCLLGAMMPSAYGQTMRFQRVAISDPHGFAKPMVAATTFLPADWRSEGGVIWTFDECAKGYSTKWSAWSANGRARIDVYPTSGWLSFSFDSPVAIPADCLQADFESALEYVTWMVQSNNGRILSAQPDPQMVAAIPSQTLSAGAYGAQARNWADAVNVLAEYGTGGEERLALISVITLHETMDAGSMGFGPRLRTVKGNALGMTIFSAPKEEFVSHLPAFYIYNRNHQTSPEWQGNVGEVLRSVTGNVIRSAGIISSMRARANAEINQLTQASAQSYQSGTSYDERMQREVTEMIRDSETYAADTFTGEVELPFGFNHAFHLDDGTFVVTNDSGFNPANDLGINGVEIHPLP